MQEKFNRFTDMIYDPNIQKMIDDIYDNPNSFKFLEEIIGSPKENEQDNSKLDSKRITEE